MQYCSFTALDLASVTSHIHNWLLFLLWLHPFILSGVISPLISTDFSGILGTYWPGEFLFQYPIILSFHTVYGVLKEEYWSGLPFPSPVDHILSDLSTMTCPSWVEPWLSFIELDKAVILVWLDWLVFCEYGFNVSALWCPLATFTVLLQFVLSWTWGTFSWLLQQSTAAAPYLGWGVSPLPLLTLNME